MADMHIRSLSTLPLLKYQENHQLQLRFKEGAYVHQERQSCGHRIGRSTTATATAVIAATAATIFAQRNHCKDCWLHYSFKVAHKFPCFISIKNSTFFDGPNPTVCARYKSAAAHLSNNAPLAPVSPSNTGCSCHTVQVAPSQIQLLGFPPMCSRGAPLVVQVVQCIHYAFTLEN